MAELVQEAIAKKEIRNDIRPTHVAFTLEGIIMFYFLTKNHVRTLGNFDSGTEVEYVMQALDTYLSALKRTKRKTKPKEE